MLGVIIYVRTFARNHSIVRGSSAKGTSVVGYAVGV